MTPNAKSQSIVMSAKLFRGFSDPSRLSILHALLDGPHAVSEIVDQTGLAQSNVSNHLSCLSECGLVRCERDGRYRRYRLSDPQIATLLGLADSLLTEAARGVYECVNYELPSHAVDRASSGDGRQAEQPLNAVVLRNDDAPAASSLEGEPRDH